MLIVIDDKGFTSIFATVIIRSSMVVMAICLSFSCKGPSLDILSVVGTQQPVEGVLSALETQCVPHPSSTFGESEEGDHDFKSADGDLCSALMWCSFFRYFLGKIIIKRGVARATHYSHILHTMHPPRAVFAGGIFEWAIFHSI